MKKYSETSCIRRRSGSGRPTKITAEIKAIVNEYMRKDEETTATQLHALLVSCGYSTSLRTILRCRTALGWPFRGSSYCQLIRAQNKEKRLAWAQLATRSTFSINTTYVSFLRTRTVNTNLYRKYGRIIILNLRKVSVFTFVR